MKEPLAPADARRLILAALTSGTVAFSQHAREEMASDRYGVIDNIDAVNVLRGGVVEPAEPERARGVTAYG